MLENKYVNTTKTPSKKLTSHNLKLEDSESIIFRVTVTLLVATVTTTNTNEITSPLRSTTLTSLGPQRLTGIFFSYHTNENLDTYLAVDYEYDDRIAGGKENDKGPREVDDIDIFWATGTFFFSFHFLFC